MSFVSLFPSLVIKELLYDLDISPKNVADERNHLQSHNKFEYLTSISQETAQLSLRIGSSASGQRRKASVNVLELISLQQQTLMCSLGILHRALAAALLPE